MSLKFKYFAIIAILHLVLTGLAYKLLIDHKWWFLASEVLILISLFFCFKLYQQLLAPIALMQSGTDALLDGDFTIKYLKTGSQEIDKLVMVFNTMIDQLRSERTSLSSQSIFIRNLIEVSPIGIVILDFDQCIEFVNPAARRLLRLNDSPEGKQISEIGHPLLDKSKDLQPGQTALVALNGIEKYRVQRNAVVHQGFTRRFLIIEDLSTEIIASQKEAYGQVIRMMAHEVNNSMGAVNSILDTVAEFGFEGQDDAEDMKESLRVAIDRNSSLARFVDRYADFIRLPKPAMASIDLGELVERSAQLFKARAASQDISISCELPNEPIHIKADYDQIGQVIANMLTNAMESISEDGDIILRVAANPPRFSVSDNGPGIAEEVSSRLFTPFFSTKPTGQGIGLMLIRDILNNHGATFRLYTDEDRRWTHFEVRF